MRLIDADFLINMGEILMFIGFFICMVGLLAMVCGWMLGNIL